MRFDGPRHRGACSISEAPAFRRKYFKKGLRVSLTAYYDQWKASNEAEAAAQAEQDRQAEAAFLLECDRIKFSRCHASKIPFNLILDVYRNSHPRAICEVEP